MAESIPSLLAHYEQMRKDLLSAIAGLNDAVLVDPSIDGWSVKDHLAHLAAWDDIRSAEISRISSGYDSAWRMTAEQDAAYGAMTYALRRSLSLAQVRWEFEASHRRLLEALSTATERGLDPSLYGEAGLRSGHESVHAGWMRRWRDTKGL